MGTSQAPDGARVNLCSLGWGHWVPEPRVLNRTLPRPLLLGSSVAPASTLSPNAGALQNDFILKMGLHGFPVRTAASTATRRGSARLGWELQTLGIHGPLEGMCLCTPAEAEGLCGGQ